jgi:hypothetical protein
MSTKINVPALVALFVVTVAVSGPAAAQYSGSRVFICPTCADYSDNYAASGFQSQSQPQLQRLKRKVPSDAYGSVGSGSVGYRSVGVGPATVVAPRGRPFETDPDPSVRFEMNRDDFDRRHSGGGG